MTNYRQINVRNGAGKIISSSIVPFNTVDQFDQDAEDLTYVENAPTRAWATLRTERAALMSASDWRFMSDQSPSQGWTDYRQALRDLPDNTQDPANVTWPTEPS